MIGRATIGRRALTERYRWAVVAVLGITYMFNLIDRSMIAILQEPIRRELNLTDSQLGILSGLAFALFYATLAVPIGRLADRKSRSGVLMCSLIIWCFATAGCGIAGAFALLVVFRVAAGVGEAGGHPPSASMISDYFEPKRRATALSVYGLGAPIGTMLGLLLGGWLNQMVGWRQAFILVGLGGLIMAPIIWFVVAEPPRGLSEPEETAREARADPGFWTVVTMLWRLRSVRFLFIANMVHGFTQYAYGAWTPAFYTRAFGFASGQLSLYLSGLAALGALGTWLGGVVADRLGRRDMRWHFWLLAIASTLTVPFAIAQFLAPSATLSLLFAAAPYFLLTVYVGPTIGASQTLVTPQVRATTAAVMIMLFNLFGLGLGPFLTGALSQALTAHFGDPAVGLRYALATLPLMELVAAGFYLRAAHYLTADLRRDRTTDFA